MMTEPSLRDPLFKGCTRPAMLFGVPLVPLAIVSCAILLVSIWTTLMVAGLLLPIILVMRMMTKSDDQQFRLLGLRLKMRGMNIPLFNRLFHCNRNALFWNASTYSPIAFKRR